MATPADVVEEALAAAITRASLDGKHDVVAALVRELEARRLARMAPNVVQLGSRKANK